MNNVTRQGAWWALVAAVISGISIYVNKFGVAQWNDPFIYTTAKNSLVGIAFLSTIGMLASRHEFSGFNARQWVMWVALGVIGGSIPFLLFFEGLAMTSAASAGLVQKTLFLWVAILAVPILGERLGRWQIAGLLIIGVGQFLLQPLTQWGAWGAGETLILMATLFWAVETILAKKFLGSKSANIGALGRMGIGSLVMWGFLAATGRAESAIAVTGTQWAWVATTSAFLFGYIWSWYHALELAPASLVTSILSIGAIITLALAAAIDHQSVSSQQLGAVILMGIGAAAFVRIPRRQSSSIPKAA